MFIKLYCSEDEKAQIERNAKDAGYGSTSKYLKSRAFAEEHQRATVVELISCMIKLVEAKEVNANIPDELFEVAQEVLNGQSILKCRERIAEVCERESKGRKR